jgi:hypothetical protein
MLTILKITTFVLLLLIMSSCGHKAFPDERFTFSSKYRNLITPYQIGDTLYFENNNGGVFRIRITGTDSTISNNIGGFMGTRASKDVKIYCDNLDYHRPNAKNTTLAFINIYPDSLEQSCAFSVMNFRGSIYDKTDSLLSVLQTTRGTEFSNCFVIKNEAPDLGEEANDFEYIYVQQNEGIIALKTYGGDWWLKRFHSKPYP